MKLGGPLRVQQEQQPDPAGPVSAEGQSYRCTSELKKFYRDPLVMSALKFSSLVLIVLSAILLLISLASDFWVSTPASFFGLWRICVQGICARLGSAADADATRAFIIISFLLLVASAVVQVIEIWISTVMAGVNKQKLVTIMNFCAACSAIIAMSVFTGSANSSGATIPYSWSYALGWVSAGLSLLAGVVALVSFKKEAK